MDLDELLERETLAPVRVDVDVDGALARTVKAGRARRRRRAVLLGGSAAALVAVVGLGVAATGDDEPDLVTATPGPTVAGPELAAPHECEAPAGSATDVASEPDWRRYADYEQWTDADGCLVRIDVIAERPGPDHCGWESTQVLITGRTIGERYSNAQDDREFIRDPEGVMGDPALTALFDPHAVVPAEAVDSGFRRGPVALWYVPGDTTAVWLVGPDGAERWPEGEAPLCG